VTRELVAGGPQAVPPSPYGASRWAASAYGRMFHALSDVPVVILGPSLVYVRGRTRPS
jgi:UDP-glucose 4-epimerase